MKLHIRIQQALIALSIGVIALLLLLIIESVLLFNQLQTSLDRERTLASAMLDSSDALSQMAEATSYLRDIALTGNLDSDARAQELIQSAQDKLQQSASLADKAVPSDLLATMNQLHYDGVAMAKAYLLDGREAGNRLMYQPDTGFDDRSRQVVAALTQNAYDIRQQLEQNAQERAETTATTRSLLMGTKIVLLFLVPAAILWLYRRLSGSINRMLATVQQLSAGDYDARCQLQSRDEMQTLGDAFDRLLDERVRQLAEVEQQNNSLNDSIISILEATGKLAEHDLRVNAPVTDDVTGAISDAINAAVADVADVLSQVRQVAEQVKDSSSTVDQQAKTVYQSAEDNLQTVEQTLQRLQQASQSMAEVLELAQSCDAIASTATQSTEQGFESVMSTTEGMNRIRTVIQETSKRIKHLGERSQEISGIVNIINDITERTHVLALNARIQAATAGEAGRGFSVVAEEVKQLAENSRNATGQIASLIQNIQLETNDTIATMEKAVSEVIQGTELSEQAGQQMVETQKTINQLAAAVQRIASASQLQTELTQQITTQAGDLKESALATRKELEVQRQQSDKLTQFSEQLTESVNIFSLPTT